jgi:hypothetical protein
MGSWGVKATESDYGLNMLAIVSDKLLSKDGYKRFNVKDALELLKEHVITGIKRANYGCSEVEMEFYISDAFPERYGQAVTLIAECLYEFFDSGAFVTSDYDNGTKKLTEHRVTKFTFNRDDLTALLNGLQRILNPEHAVSRTWEDSDSFNGWQAHINSLCESIEKQISSNGNDAK